MGCAEVAAYGTLTIETRLHHMVKTASTSENQSLMLTALKLRFSLSPSALAFLIINKRIKVLMRRNLRSKLRNIADCALNDDLDAFENDE